MKTSNTLGVDMLSLINNQIDNLKTQAVLVNPATLFVIRTEGYDFDGESVFVLTADEINFAEKTGWSEVLECASAWCFLKDFEFSEGCPEVYEDTGETVLVKYRKNGHIFYKEMKISSFLPENQFNEDDDDILPGQDVFAYCLL